MSQFPQEEQILLHMSLQMKTSTKECATVPNSVYDFKKHGEQKKKSPQGCGTKIISSLSFREVTDCSQGRVGQQPWGSGRLGALVPPGGARWPEQESGGTRGRGGQEGRWATLVG